jgi:hypothetical protein
MAAYGIPEPDVGRVSLLLGTMRRRARAASLQLQSPAIERRTLLEYDKSSYFL